jgi:hypothetical protein
VQLRRARDDLEATGGGIVLIGQATPRHAAHFRRRLELDPWPLLADEGRVSYRAAGAKIATMGELLGPRSVARGMRASARSGVVQGRTIGHPAQLGGTIVVRPGDAIVWTHLSEDASDNASPEEIVSALSLGDPE